MENKHFSKMQEVLLKENENRWVLINEVIAYLNASREV
jgi:hypothetical protein